MKLLYSLFFIALSAYLKAQSTCTFNDELLVQKKQLEYSFTQISRGGEYETSYLLKDSKGFPFKAISVVNKKPIRQLSITIRELTTGKIEQEYLTSYSTYSGLFITERSDTLSTIPKLFDNIFVLSFEDEKKQFLFLHTLKYEFHYTIRFSDITEDKLRRSKSFLQQMQLYQKELQKQQIEIQAKEQARSEIDSLVNIRVKEEVERKLKESTPSVQRDLIKSEIKSESSQPPTASLNNIVNENMIHTFSLFQGKIIKEAEEFFVKFYTDSIKIATIEKEILDKQTESNQLDPSRLLFDDGCSYNFTKDRTLNRNIGIAICDVKNSHKIYQGIFNKYEFESGQVYFVLKNKETYIGSYDNNNYSGLGERIRFNIFKDIEIGDYKSSLLQKGVVRLHINDNTLYTGKVSMGKRNGFGIYANTRGNKFIGLFENDKLIDGYKSVIEDDMTNVKTYYKISDSVQEKVSKEEWEKINGGVELIKNKYMP